MKEMDFHLLEAILDHDQCVTELIAQGSDVHCRNGLGRTPIFIAVESDNLKAVQCLVKAGADVDAVADDRTTPLWHAITRSGKINLDLVRYLLNQGADPDAPDGNDNTLLHHALMRDLEEGDLDVIRALIQHGANVHARNKDGEQPIHIAAQGGNVDAIEVLVQAGSDINAHEEDVHQRGTTPLQAVLSHRPGDHLALMVELGANVNLPDKEGRSPLERACRLQIPGAVRELIRLGANIETVDRHDNNLIQLSITWCKTDLIDFLIEQGASVNHRNKAHESPLMAVALYGYYGDIQREVSLDKMNHLIKRGAEVLQEDRNELCRRFVRDGVTDDFSEILEAWDIRLAEDALKALDDQSLDDSPDQKEEFFRRQPRL